VTYAIIFENALLLSAKYLFAHAKYQPAASSRACISSSALRPTFDQFRISLYRFNP
jgi:hypothetical protein